MVFIVFMIASGIGVEVARSILLRRRHGMTSTEYYRRKANGQDVPRL